MKRLNTTVLATIGALLAVMLAVLPAQAATSSSHPAAPSTGLHHDLIRLSAAEQREALAAPQSLVPHKCGYPSSVAFILYDGVGILIDCWQGHGTQNVNEWNVESFVSYYQTGGQFNWGPNNTQCSQQDFFGSNVSVGYPSPGAHVCTLQLY